MNLINPSYSTARKLLVFRNIIAVVLFFGLLVWTLGPIPLVIKQAQATVTPTVTSLISQPLRTKASSAPRAAIKVIIAVDAGEQLAALTVAATDSGATGFDPATDLAALSSATEATSGVAIYDDTGATVGSFDGTDAAVDLSAASAWSSNATTLTFQTPGAAGTYYVVFRTVASPTNNHAFVLTLPTNGITTTANSPTLGAPVSTSAITIDTVAPTVIGTAPSNNGTGVPISTFMHYQFSENMNGTTINPSNISVTTGGTPIPITVKPYPDGFDISFSGPPGFVGSTNFARVNTGGTAFYPMFNNGQSFTPSGGYASPILGDVVYFQNQSFPPEIGVITNATLTTGTFQVNNFPLMGGQQLTKFGTVATTGAEGTATSLTVGDIIVANTSANPTNDRYRWHLVTAGTAVNDAALRLDGSAAAPTFVTSSRISAITPSATATDNGSTGGGTLAVNAGDLVFVKIGSSYDWHIVTTTGNMSSDAGEGTAVVDGLNAAGSLVAANSQMSKLTPAAQAAVGPGDTTSFSFGDIVYAKTNANAAYNDNYAFHLVTGSATGISSSNLRFDNASTPLAVSTTYVMTATTGITDIAGNALASNQVVTFTTGATGGTNTTTPFIQSSIPQQGNQQFPPNGVIKLTFSVDMSTTGGNSGANSVTAPANVGLFVDNYGAPGAAVPVTNTYDSGTKTVTITPSTSMNSGVAANLNANTGYVVRVLPAVQSSTGTAMTNSFFVAFRTAGAVDSTAPAVMGTAPSNGSTSIPRATVVNIGFSKDMDPSTISTSTIKLEKTSDSSQVTGTVNYNSTNRSGTFTPSGELLGNTEYRIRVIAGASGAKSVAGVQLGVATPANDYTATFTTNNTTDSTPPSVVFSGADNFGLAVTFNEQVKSGSGPNAADNIANYTLESPTGSSVSLAGKSVTYDGGNRTARITGLSLQNGNTYKITVGAAVQDLAGNGISTAGTPPANVSYGTVANADSTGGQLGPGTGINNPGMQGMNPVRVMPMNRAAGATSNYKIEFPVTTSVPLGGQIVLTFPNGFTITNAAAATAGTNSFCNSDLNGPMANTVTIASVSNDNAAGNVTITTGGGATGSNAFLCMDLTTIINTTVPNSSGYTVDIKTKDTAGNNRAILETKTSAPFFLGQVGSGTLKVHVFKDANSNNTNDAGEGINDVTAFLFSSATGGQEALTANDTVDGVATFSNLMAGEYMVGLKPTAAIDVAFNSAPQPISIPGSGTTTKKFALSSAAAIEIQGAITWSGSAGVKVDVFANSPNGFTKKVITLTGGGASDNYSLPVSPNSFYNIGVGPYIPETFQTPGSPPPSPPTFVFMPPSPLQVSVESSTVTGKNFTLTATSKTISGTVVDANGSGVSNAGVSCRPIQSSTTGPMDGFGVGGMTSTTGTFSINVTPGAYLCNVFKPGMPPVPDKQINVPTTGTNSPSSLSFVLNVGTSLTITGTLKDDSGNAIPYGGVSGRKVNSTSDTTPLGGDAGNFVGGPTDGNGAYTLYVTAGTWVVEAFAQGFGRLGTKTISVTTSNVTGQDFSAQTMSLGTITGSTTQGGTAVQGAMVRAENTSGTAGNMTPTNSDGTFSLKVPAGTYTLYCFFPGLGEGTPITGVTVTANNTTSGQNCTLASPITITVNVTDGTNPITNAGVDVRGSNGRGNFTNISTSSGANAVYTIQVPPGTYVVRVGHPAYGKIGETLNVNSTRTITHTASVGTTYAVTGTVTGDGSNLANAWVSLIGTPTGTNNSIFLGASTQSNGTFSISVPTGSYRVRVDKPGYRSPAESSITVTGATAVGTIALTTAARTITGIVYISGNGVSNAFVDAADGAGGYAVAQTDSTGAYSLAVDNGTWTLRARAPGYEGGPLPVTVNSNSPSGQNITLSAISGFVMKPEKPETVTPTNGGFLTNPDIGNDFKLNIPANALGTGSNAATVTTKVNTAVPNPPSGTVLNKNAVTINAVGADGSRISSLNDSITISIPYDESELPVGALEENLVIGTWNDATQTYDTLTTTVDTVNNILTATTAHLSDFAPLIPSSESAPSTPTNLTVTSTGTSTTLALSWTAVSGAANYNIYRSTNNSSFPLLANTTNTTYSSGGLTTNTTYYYKVSAVNAASAESAATSAVSGVPSATGGGGGGGGGGSTTPTNTTTSATFTSDKSSITSGTSVILTWSTTNATTVNIDQSIGTVATSGTKSVSPTTTTTYTLTATGSSGTVTKTVTITVTAGQQNEQPATTTSGGAHPNGTLVIDNGTVYLISDGKRVGFRNAKEYASYGYNFGQVVSANAQDKALPQAEFVHKAMEGTLVIDASDNRTVYMIGVSNTKRGFVSATVFKDLGYSFANLPKIDLTDYPNGPAVSDSTAVHPDGSLVLDGQTIWWIRNNQKTGFESMAVFNTYGFSLSRVVKANEADKALIEGSLVKFRDGTLVLDGGTYYLISDGKKLAFTSVTQLTDKGYKTANAVSASLSAYVSGGDVQ